MTQPKELKKDQIPPLVLCRRGNQQWLISLGKAEKYSVFGAHTYEPVTPANIKDIQSRVSAAEAKGQILAINVTGIQLSDPPIPPGSEAGFLPETIWTAILEYAANNPEHRFKR